MVCAKVVTQVIIDTRQEFLQYVRGVLGRASPMCRNQDEQDLNREGGEKERRMAQGGVIHAWALH